MTFTFYFAAPGDRGCIKRFISGKLLAKIAETLNVAVGVGYVAEPPLGANCAGLGDRELVWMLPKWVLWSLGQPEFR